MTTTDSRPARERSTSIARSPTASGSLNGHSIGDAHPASVVEGSTSPQASRDSSTIQAAPAGSAAAQSAKQQAAANSESPTGHKNDRGHHRHDTQTRLVPADGIPAGHELCDIHSCSACGDSSPPARASGLSRPKADPPGLADPLLALAADVLGDLEKVRIANENRLRQLTRAGTDKDGETRGFGLDEAHPDVARLAALVGMLADAEHKATLNLGRLMRAHPLGPWLKAQKGVGEKQGARLLAAIGDPYIRPEIEREDGTVEPSRPRSVSELWALCGYHVIQVPVSGHRSCDAHPDAAADGQDGGDPGHAPLDIQARLAGVAPKRARGQKANWSSTAKMRAFLVAESCMKQSGTKYRDLYDATRAKYANAVHETECIRCGPKGKPAQPGSVLSDGHKHARALRAVAKEVLKGLWCESKRIHETCASGHSGADTHACSAAGALEPERAS